MKRRARRLEEQFECYQFTISRAWLGYSSRRTKEEHNEHFNLALDVELLQPVKGVQAGHLLLVVQLRYGAQETLGHKRRNKGVAQAFDESQYLGSQCQNRQDLGDPGSRQFKVLG